MLAKTPLLSVAVIFFFTANLYAQPCNTLGQNPSTAFPVCGTSTFTQTIVPLCQTHDILVPCSVFALYQDRNPFWYKFTCFSAGTLGFIVTPVNSGDDYDWQLFDITGHNPDDVFTDASLFVACNWSGWSGPTGASSAGASLIECAGAAPLFSMMPTLIVNHNYLLLVSHFTDTQEGYDLNFTGGTAVITDPIPPALGNATVATCDPSTITVILNKKMKCSSLAADGSDFSISPFGVIQSASGGGCSNGFDMDTVIIRVAAPLLPGNYILSVKNGIDANTIQDNCGTNIPVGDNVSFSITILPAVQMRSVTAPGCRPTTVQLKLSRPAQCNSVATDGSDFIITGPSNIIVNNATPICNNGVTDSVILQLTSSIAVGGNYQLKLINGSDGNTLLNECSTPAAPGSTISFNVADTVDGRFVYQILPGCAPNEVNFFGNNNSITSWNWQVNGLAAGNQVNCNSILNGPNTISLKVSNGICSDSSSQVIDLTDNKILTDFNFPAITCPEDVVVFKNTTTGTIDTWHWDFGNGQTSSVKDPLPLLYATTGNSAYYTISLTASNNMGCVVEKNKTINILGTCIIAVPSGFTPNNDGLNDYLYPLNAFKAVDLDFKIFNRWGQLVFSSNNWLKKWDGTFKGVLQGGGVYVWMLTYKDDSGKKYFYKGTSLLIR
jgi:gliding motility-associated-like protein